MDKTILTWDKYSEIMKKANKEIDFSNVDLIVGLTRGGLAPAVQFSNENNIRMLALNCSLRDFQSEEKYVKDLEEIKKYDNILIIDDIYDSGKTVEKIREDLSDKNIKFYCIYSTKEDGVEYYSVFKKGNDWIVFPWETI